MEIRDPVHGSIHILDEEIPIITNNFFQRLRNIKQLGFSENVFPGSTHTRYLHSLGVMSVGQKAFEKLFSSLKNHPEIERLKETFKLACLLHDIGHAPLSHATESVMPKLKELDLPPYFLHRSIPERGKLDRQATHEDYTIKTIVDSSMSPAFDQVKKSFQIERRCIADLILGQTMMPDYFTIEGINYFPILHQLISSEMDCDRMDYLLRDSYFCGVSYGHYDLDWLIDNLEICIIKDEAYLGITERAVVTFDDFLLSRFHMFLMVYFHYRSVCLEKLLERYFATSPLEYSIPADIEEYLEHDDHFLMKVLRKSLNPNAQAIVKNQIPQKIFESFNHKQFIELEKIKEFLNNYNIDYIQSCSSGRISKYYTTTPSQNQNSLKVVRELGKKKYTYSCITEATDLFEKFSKAHEVNRLHCNIDQLPPNIQSDLIALINPSIP